MYPNDARRELIKVYIRPGCEQFLEKLSKIAEVVVFTASLAEYANPILDRIDPHGYISHRLYRETTIPHKGRSHVKSLKKLGRDLRTTFLVDNSKRAAFEMENLYHIPSYYGSPHDTELEDLYEFGC